MNGKVKYFDGKRKGVTPVIAVLLLLMMTVAAAGGAYVWMTSLQDQLKSQTQDEVTSFDRSISMSDVRCMSDGTVEVLLRNSGDKELDLDPVDMEVRDTDTGNINASISKFDMDISSATDSDDVSNVDGGGIKSPGGTGVYTISAGGNFEADRLYEITLIFKDEDSYDISATCRGESAS